MKIDSHTSALATCIALRNELYTALNVLGDIPSSDKIVNPERLDAHFETDLSAVGSTTDTLGHTIFPGNCQQFLRQVDQLTLQVESCFDKGTSLRFNNNWFAQRPAFKQTLSEFFGSDCCTAAYVAVRKGRLCFTNAIGKTYNCSMDTADVHVKPVNNFDFSGDFRVYMGWACMDFDLPLSGVRFASSAERGGVAANGSEFLHRQTMDRLGKLGSVNLKTEHTYFGCTELAVLNPERSEFLDSHLDAAKFDGNGVNKRLLYVDNYDIDLCRYIPIHHHCLDYLVQKINWNIDKETGFTTGISICYGLESLSHVMIPDIVNHLTAVTKQL